MSESIISISAEAAAESKRMTLGELAAFVDRARAIGVSEAAELEVQSKGLGRLKRITTVSPKS